MREQLEEVMLLVRNEANRISGDGKPAVSPRVPSERLNLLNAAKRAINIASDERNLVKASDCVQTVDFISDDEVRMFATARALVKLLNEHDTSEGLRVLEMAKLVYAE
jgi:hypothetical protein